MQMTLTNAVNDFSDSLLWFIDISVLLLKIHYKYIYLVSVMLVSMKRNDTVIFLDT